MKLRAAFSLIVLLFAGKLFGQAESGAAAGDAPTYAKNVAPILQSKCQVCHRPGEAGPFPLLSKFGWPRAMCPQLP